MKQGFDQLLKFLHDAISAIFRFVELIWTWSVDQISRLATPAVAAVAAVEAVATDPGRSGLGALSSGPRALGGGRGHIERIRSSARRARANSAACRVGWHYRAWRGVAH